MTLALIVAEKNSFYVVTDTLTQNVDEGYYTTSIKKEFISLKHKIGICIAGGAAIGFKDDWPEIHKALLTEYNAKDYHFNTDYIIYQFISYIDTKKEFAIDELHQEMSKFLDNFFRDRLNVLETTLTPDLFIKLIGMYSWAFYKDVTYLYGGFTEEQGITKTAIYLYKAHENLSKEQPDNPIWQVCDEDSVFFANTNAVNVSIDQVLKCLESQGTTVTEPQLLGNEEYFCKNVIPRAVYFLNNDDNGKHYVSNILHLKKLWSDGNQAYRKLSYNASDITINSEIVNDPRLTYTLYPTTKLMEEYISNGSIKKYDLYTGIEIPVVSNEVITSEVTSVDDSSKSLGDLLEEAT